MREEKFDGDSKIFLTWACGRICMNNSYLFEVIRSFFQVNHYQITRNVEDCDVIIINTCGYTDDTARENVKFIHEIKARYAEKKIIVFGCISKISEAVKGDANLTLVGAKELHRFSELFHNSTPCGDTAYLPYALPPNTPEMQNEENRGFVQISQGCTNNCSYCNIKIAKGYVRSKSIPAINAEFLELKKVGVQEVTLLADDCGSYGHDIHTNIGELISELLRDDENLKIKIYTIFPGLFLKYYPSLRRFYFNGQISYTCLPLQSGSRKILKLMNRDYDLYGIEQAVSEIKSENPRARLFTHIIVNFPAETLDDFRLSLEVAAIFDYALLLPYGENSRTEASAIQEKCSRGQLATKLRLAEEAIKTGFIKGLVIY